MNGSETVIGGSIIMPTDIRIEATTRSMMMKGTKSRKPISKARRSSEIMKAGTSTCNWNIVGALEIGLTRHVDEEFEIALADMGER